jgi:hypothetical protein
VIAHISMAVNAVACKAAAKLAACIVIGSQVCLSFDRNERLVMLLYRTLFWIARDRF